MSEPKSVWERVSCDTPRSQEAARSWFVGVADGMQGPSKVNILTCLADDRTLKIRALFIDEKGGERELLRTFGRTFTVTSRRPSKQRWA